MNRVKTKSLTTLSLLCVFVATGMCIPSRCVATIRGDTQADKLMGRIYEVCYLDGLRCHDIHTKFRKEWLGLQKLIRVIWINRHERAHTARISNKPSSEKRLRFLFGTLSLDILYTVTALTASLSNKVKKTFLYIPMHTFHLE
jgi:hypothetical protein